MKYLIALCLLIQQPVLAEVKNMSLDFSLDTIQLKEGDIAYGWKLMPWEEWLTRPTSGPLMIKTNFDKNNVEVFEAHAATIISKPATQFTEDYLHNINTIRKLDPEDQHTQIGGPRFSVETVIPFPHKWSAFISMAKTTKLLADKTTDYIKMDSVYIYASPKAIKASPDLQRKIRLLDNSHLEVVALNVQGSQSVNQIADFISMATVFYKIGDTQTLVVTSIAAALKKDVLNLGLKMSGTTLNGRAVLLGQNAVFNTESGIGAGLPKYFLELFYNMTRGLAE